MSNQKTRVDRLEKNQPETPEELVIETSYVTPGGDPKGVLSAISMPNVIVHRRKNETEDEFRARAQEEETNAADTRKRLGL